ncbi:hypothetical protein BJAS_P4002 [Bathymodiolus japonicus methanotrophic gill symbiont]|uniref:toprim domain-containing protein n=1 Tax=Bathymodiolus japonicus methanotrophic gill symbiont TaxID=113269 RepID=UPI001B532EFD|nr:toprim domain-containing protein [Bathymodiolus japonicus methanotrophic gill symbiont]GFO73285.1 hypothetical protein BJAS_P4002 [Bathymodiolus japonicus methanotrophic gill symbiont]
MMIKFINRGTGPGKGAIDQRVGVEASGGAGDFNRAIISLNKGSRAFEQTISKCSEIIKGGIDRVIKNSDAELDLFKTEINLAEYAACHGYQVVKRKSSKGFIVMGKSENSQKITICTAADGHGIYFENPNMGAKTVIDMCKEEENCNLGYVRKILRKFAGHPDIKNLPELKKPQKTEKDLIKVRSEVSVMKVLDVKNSYLKSRGISEETLKDKRFLVLQDEPWKNVTFIHYNKDNEVCGYEQKNKGKSAVFDANGNTGKSFTFFSKGGEKGIWRSNNINKAEAVVICEAGIDALSHAELKETGADVAYMSFCGQMSDEQLLLIKKLSNGKNIVIATDNDNYGDVFAEKIEKHVKGVALSVERDIPEGKDWNNDLKEEKTTSESIKSAF